MTQFVYCYGREELRIGTLALVECDDRAAAESVNLNGAPSGGFY